MNRVVLDVSWHYFKKTLYLPDNWILRGTQFCLIYFLLTINLTSVSIQQYLSNNLQQLLGADVVVSQYHPLTKDQKKILDEVSSKRAITQLVDITLTHKHLWQRAQLKIVDQFYPIQGKIRTSRVLGGESDIHIGGPEPGEVWLDSRLFTSLSITPGESIQIGDNRFLASRVLLHEPDRLLEGHSVAMRAMVSNREFDSLVDLSDSVQYRYLLSIPSSDYDSFIDNAAINFPGAKVFHREGGHPLANFWTRVENFLGLTAVLLFVMAAIAMNLACRRQIDRHQQCIAVCMSQGLKVSQGVILSIYLWLFNFVTSLIPVFVAAYLSQIFIVTHLQAQFPQISHDVSVFQLSKVILILATLLAIFYIPMWLRLSKTTIAQLIRPVNSLTKGTSYLIFYGISIAFLATLYSDNLLLTGLSLASMSLAMLLMIGLTWCVLILGEVLLKDQTGLLSFSFYVMRKRLTSKSVQILGIGLCTTLLLFSFMLLKDISESMQRYTRTHDGNLLISMAKQTQIESIEKWALKSNSTIKQLKPFFHGQLVSVNNTSLEEFAPGPSESLAGLQKPVRVHYSQTVPINNKIVNGNWWGDNDKDWRKISIESEVMTDVGLKLGDTLDLLIAGEIHSFELVASHEYRPGFGSITFWFVAPPRAFKELAAPSYYMGSMELTREGWDSLSELWRDFPSLRMVSLQELTERFDAVLKIILKLVSFFSGLISVLAMLVVFASVKGFEKEDKRKNGLLLSFGLSKRKCYLINWYEWIATALIAGCGAMFGTYLSGEMIYQSQFAMAYQPDLRWLVTTLLIVLACVCCIGMASCRSSVNTRIQELFS